MTWGDIQLESLKKMFLNKDDLSIENLPVYKTDKKYKTYLYAMPQAVNEAINIIVNVTDKPIVDSKEYKKEEGSQFLLKSLDNFKNIREIIADKDPINYTIINDELLIIKNWNNSNTITIYYEKYPELITKETQDNYKIPLSTQQLLLLPLYIAGELYKDDDIQIATIYMNEFETNLSIISNKKTNLTNQVQTIYRMNL